jgi:uncharacterized protein (TIGR02300 family)
MPELGNKFECYSCGAKFYDLGKPQPICPKCGANQKDAAAQAKASHDTGVHRRRRKEEPARAVDEGEEPPLHDDVEGAEVAHDEAEHEDEEEDVEDEG